MIAESLRKGRNRVVDILALFGPTDLRYDGSFGDGTIFELDATGRETILHNSAGSSDGAAPYAGNNLQRARNQLCAQNNVTALRSIMGTCRGGCIVWSRAEECQRRSHITPGTNSSRLGKTGRTQFAHANFLLKTKAVGGCSLRSTTSGCCDHLRGSPREWPSLTAVGIQRFPLGMRVRFMRPPLQAPGPQVGHICAGMRGKTGHQQPAKALENQHRVRLIHAWQSRGRGFEPLQVHHNDHDIMDFQRSRLLLGYQLSKTVSKVPTIDWYRSKSSKPKGAACF